MASRDDRRAAVILLALAAAGLVVRFWQPPGAAPGAVGYRGSGARPGRDSVLVRAARLARPLARGERVDLDRAGAEDLGRLPRVGPSLAARIVAYREEHGPFGSLEALDRVPGVGPTLLAALRPHVTFSATPATSAAPTVGGRRGPGKVSLNTATETELIQLPGIGPALARAIVADRAAHGPYRNIEDLTRVRGIGAATVRALQGRILVP